MFTSWSKVRARGPVNDAGAGEAGLRRLARQVDGSLAAAAQLLGSGVAAAVRVAAFQLGDIAGLAHAPCHLPASGLQVSGGAVTWQCRTLSSLPENRELCCSAVRSAVKQIISGFELSVIRYMLETYVLCRNGNSISGLTASLLECWEQKTQPARHQRSTFARTQAGSRAGASTGAGGTAAGAVRADAHGGDGGRRGLPPTVCMAAAVDTPPGRGR